ncbi:MAG: type II toxin-antitoxin system Phd/YefM family antitoxin [Gammaproteobacteria bacterium]
MDISAATFKAECLKLMDQVEKTREPIVITKHGRPVAQLAPVSTGPRSLFGYMKGTLRIAGDILPPMEGEWSALSGDEDHLYERTPAKRARHKK